MQCVLQYLVFMCAHGGVYGCWCHILQIAFCHGVKVFWMCSCHLVTIAETDRGAVGQSRVGVLNELS